MILVTGGTGLLGSRLLFDLTSRGEKVKAIKRSSSNLDTVRRVFSYYSENPGELLYKIEWVDGDIMDVDSLMESMHNVRQVYHAAAFVSFDPKVREKLIRNNVEGTRNVVNACLTNSIDKLCHVSSTAALGPPDPDGFIREDSLWTSERSTSGYSVSKYKSELEVWRGIEEGLKTVIVNPSIILGPGFWDKGSSGMFSAVYRGFKFYTHGVTGYVSVEDVSMAMIALMKSHYSGERFILSSENLSYKQIFEMISDSLGKKPPFIEAKPFLGNIAWRLENLKILFGGNRLITKETVLASQNKASFSNEKFSQAFNAEFQPVTETIRNMGKYFIKDLEEGWLDRKAKSWKKP
jgi:nucleoside-diphosphate-sugar epimerase